MIKALGRCVCVLRMMPPCSICRCVRLSPKNDHGMSWWPKLKQQIDWGSWKWDHVVCFQVEGKRVSFKNCLTETLEVCKNIQTICNECNVYTVYTSFVLVCINYVHGVLRISQNVQGCSISFQASEFSHLSHAEHALLMVCCSKPVILGNLR
jgi:hypothetical protein